MTIPISRYVRIISGVGAGVGVRERELIARILTESPRIGAGVVLEFQNATDVATYFGASSQEAARARAYFGYVSPSVSAPRKISFARYSPTGHSSLVLGNNAGKSLAALKGVATGGITVLVANVGTAVSGISFASANSLADVAAALQTAIRAAGGVFTSATVSYGTVDPGRFEVDFVGVTDEVEILSASTGGDDVGRLMGLTVASGAIPVQGGLAQTPLEALQASLAVTDNCGSLLFQSTLTDEQVVSLGEFVNAENVKYMLCLPVSSTNAADRYELLKGYAGVALTLTNGTEYAEQSPAEILSATDYAKRNGVQSYMFRQFAGRPATVSSSSDADRYDAIRVNYIGDTSSAGQKIAFYQRGTLCGTGAAPTDMNVYANEQWFKAAATATLLSLLLNQSRVPANATGRGMLTTTLQGVVNRALLNGTISVGKDLNDQQKLFIAQKTGDDNAWQTVQNEGYVVQVVIESYVTTSGATEFKAVYEIIYSKDDAIRFIDGTHVLI